MFSKQLRHINRYRQIATVLANQGFGYLIEEMDFIKKIPYHERLRIKPFAVNSIDLGERIRIVLQELGPTYIKLGQIASTRPDILPSEIIVHLEKLQDEVSAIPFEQVQNLIKEELRADIEEIFLEFDSQPLAAASIGQVHVATLESGQKVAVKVQRPGIAADIETDLEILFEIAVAAQNRFQWAKQYQIADMVDEFAKSLRRELDYTIEARNTDKISIQLKDQTDFYIPTIYWDYSTKRILTTEFIQGIKVNQSDLLLQQGYNLSLIANRFAKGIFHQIFIEGFFHGDPHPGNIIVLPKEVIGFLDFGMVGRLGSEMKNSLSSLLLGLKRNNTDDLMKAILRIGIVSPEVNLRQLRDDVELFKDTYYGLPLSKISIGKAITNFFRIAQKHSIRVPSDLVLVGKALLTVEGVVKKLDPALSLIDIVEPFGEKLLLERMHPRTIAESVWKTATDFGDFFNDIPRNAKELSRVINHGRLHLDVSFSETELFLKHLAQISNRISVSIMLLAFSILMGSIIISFSLMGQASLLWNFPIVEIGFFIAILMFVWVLYGIIRSGKL
ncbi:AarF/ABC1/UbiB kinase family protein [Sporomusa sp. KB1]|jgi:ubiquinone biosynthesis protein|uniref:ABC1 kinase family protein n=1 Tax=Sporomusa sp. KB1 TaxID=943346 RepID=UPI00119CFAC2|nr:AarF/ABC1/UbiB kinase family protein [Sporomusa sp. KB1]TWH51690.1 2-octaprenylphenol hydroxylase [Sporomusa sp. KB1]